MGMSHLKNLWLIPCPVVSSTKLSIYGMCAHMQHTPFLGPFVWWPGLIQRCVRIAVKFWREFRYSVWNFLLIVSRNFNLLILVLFLLKVLVTVYCGDVDKEVPISQVYRVFQNLCHRLFLGIPHPKISKKVPINMGPKMNRFRDIDLRSRSGTLLSIT